MHQTLPIRSALFTNDSNVTGALTIHDKLALARKRSRPPLNQQGLADLLEVSRSTISRYETDAERTPPSRYIRLVAERLGIPLDWFLEPDVLGLDHGMLPNPVHGYGAGVGQAPPGPSHDSHERPYPVVGRRKFPLVGSAGAATFPLKSADIWPGDFVEFSDDLFRVDRFAIRVQGDSMHPRVEHGDFILVHPDGNPPYGLLTVARNAEYEYAVKIRRRMEDRDVLMPSNPDFPPLLPEEGWEMIGYAVGLRRERGPGRYLEEGDNAGMRGSGS